MSLRCVREGSDGAWLASAPCAVGPGEGPPGVALSSRVGRGAGCEGVQPKCHRPLYERQGSRHKFLAVQPHMSRADAPVPVHGMEF